MDLRTQKEQELRFEAGVRRIEEINAEMDRVAQGADSERVVEALFEEMEAVTCSIEDIHPPLRIREAEAAAQSRFCNDYPERSFRFCKLGPVEPARYIVWVHYRLSEEALPPSIPMAYEVSRDCDWARQLVGADAQAYQPGLKHDPLEDDPAIAPLIEAAMAEATEIVERQWEENGYNARELMGKVPNIWKETARILRERHGIEWKNLMQMNDGFFVD